MRHLNNYKTLRGQLRRQYDDKKTSLALIPIDAHWWTAQSGALGTTFTFWDKEAKTIFYKRHKLALINLIPYLIAIVFGIVYRYGNKLQIKLMRRPFLLQAPRISG